MHKKQTIVNSLSWLSLGFCLYMKCLNNQSKLSFFLKSYCSFVPQNEAETFLLTLLLFQTISLLLEHVVMYWFFHNNSNWCLYRFSAHNNNISMQMKYPNIFRFSAWTARSYTNYKEQNRMIFFYWKAKKQDLKTP